MPTIKESTNPRTIVLQNHPVFQLGKNKFIPGAVHYNKPVSFLPARKNHRRKSRPCSVISQCGFMIKSTVANHSIPIHKLQHHLENIALFSSVKEITAPVR